MAGKRKKEGVYSIQELAPEVRKKVLEKWRYEIWDQHDSDQLSEDFKRTLSERGFTDPEVCWSLSSSQGDGVAFWGYLDLRDFFRWVFSGEQQAKSFIKDARKFVMLQNVVGVRIKHESRYCHYNSMNVELEVTGEEIDLIPDKHRGEVNDFLRQQERVYDDWNRIRHNILYERSAPIRQWEKLVAERSKSVPKGPKEWRPGSRALPPKPEPLDIPIPPEPEFRMPVGLQRMMVRAHLVFKDIDPLMNELQKFLEEWVKETSRELEKSGYDEMEYRQSDEQIEEFLDANGYEFDEEGEEL